MPGPSPAPAFTGVDLAAGVPAVMRDGTRLVADVYTPQGAGPWPVLLMRTAYGRDVASSVVYAHPPWYARQGFIVVVQDVRGRGDSGGTYYPFRHDRADGYDSVQWAAALPGSNGCVGLYGFSYQGAVQLFSALDRPPALRALAPHMAAFDFYGGWFYRGGMLDLPNTMGWAAQMLREDARRLGSPRQAALDAAWGDLPAFFRQLPLRAPAAFADPALPRYAADWLAHSARDAYWDEFNLLKHTRELGYPMFHLAGWYDIFLRGTIEGFTAMARERDDQFLLAGPWVHMPLGTKIAGVDFGPEAAAAVNELVAEWFKYWLRPGPLAGPCPLRGVNYFVMGANTWRRSPAWPPPGGREVAYYLQSGGRANSRFGDGRLATEAPAGPEDVYSYEPEVPVRAAGGTHYLGPHELSVQQQSNALLVYTTAALAAPLTIAGTPRCSVHVQASTPTLDLFARLSRVTTDGRAILLSLGGVTSAMAGLTRVEVTLDPVAASFAPGERLRLDLASSAFPLYPRNSGSSRDALDVANVADFRRALVSVWHDPQRPSALFLPTLS
jgi:putative CocE/NonD family hydrolase